MTVLWDWNFWEVLNPFPPTVAAGLLVFTATIVVRLLLYAATTDLGDAMKQSRLKCQKSCCPS